MINWSAHAIELMKTDSVASVLSHILPTMAAQLDECNDVLISIGTTSFALFLSLVVELGKMIKWMVCDLKWCRCSTLHE